MIGEREDNFDFNVSLGDTAPFTYVILSTEPYGLLNEGPNDYNSYGGGVEHYGYHLYCTPLLSSKITVMFFLILDYARD